LQVRKSVRAVSTLIAILLIVIAAIFGGLISYMWAIAPFYATPKNVGIAVTGVNFQVNHGDYFDVTVLNPSFSQGETNITSVFLAVQNQSSIFNMTDISPALPLSLAQGASTTIRCYYNWGRYAGENMTVTVFPLGGTGASFPVQTQFVSMTANGFFNATQSVEYFYVSVQNDPQSAINLTLRSVTLDTTAISVVVSSSNVTLPMSLNIGQTVVLQCFYDWEGHSAPDLIVGTQEGYTAESEQNVSASALVQVSDVQFNETDPTRISVTLTNSPESATPVDISNVTIAYINETDGINVTNIINGNISNPALPYPLEINSSSTFDCQWNWTDPVYRNIAITLTANTSQGFVSQPSTFTTPQNVSGRIDQVNFDLNDTGDFVVNMTNLFYSLQSINVTGISLNSRPTVLTPTLLSTGEQVLLDCTFNWSSYVGQVVTITANSTYGSNQTLVLTLQVTVPYYSILNLSFGNFTFGNPCLNVTIRNSEFSVENANITKISVSTGNHTEVIDGTISYPAISQGYLLASGNNTTIVCPWNWTQYVGSEVTVTVQTADGSQASLTSEVQ